MEQTEMELDVKVKCYRLLASLTAVPPSTAGHGRPFSSVGISRSTLEIPYVPRTGGVIWL